MAIRDRINRRLRLRDLHMLETIAARGSMARAAEVLGLSQPATSKAIADLERDLGVCFSAERTVLPLSNRLSRHRALFEGSEI